MKKNVPNQVAKNPTQFNIAAIAKLEEEALDRRTRTERDSDAIVKFTGSVRFLRLHVIFVAGWIVVNLGMVPHVKSFDPFPFGILALFVASESVFLTISVLISQDRMARQAERRSHLDLQVSMLRDSGSARSATTSRSAANFPAGRTGLRRSADRERTARRQSRTREINFWKGRWHREAPKRVITSSIPFYCTQPEPATGLYTEVD